MHYTNYNNQISNLLTTYVYPVSISSIKRTGVGRKQRPDIAHAGDFELLRLLLNNLPEKCSSVASYLLLPFQVTCGMQWWETSGLVKRARRASTDPLVVLTLGTRGSVGPGRWLWRWDREACNRCLLSCWTVGRLPIGPSPCPWSAVYAPTHQT